MKNKLFIVLITLTTMLSLTLHAPAQAGGYHLEWNTFDAGGYTFSSGTYTLGGGFWYSPAAPQSSSIRYAAPSAVGSGNCSSWANACTLQTALTGAASGDEIWVKAGVHYPGVNRTDTFTLRNNVAIYGGFAGTETSRDERDWQTHVTVLSGDIDHNDTNTDGNFIAETVADIQGNNAYHVVTGGGTGNTAVLDGFIITAGQATGSLPHNFGGGLLNLSGGNPTLTNITFSGNAAESGGGMFNYLASSPSLTHITFSGNAAENGGGMFNGNSNPTLTDVTFSGNVATNGGGGGMSNTGSSPLLTDVTFAGNSASAAGGGMFNSNSNPTLTDVTFSGNVATNGGGGGMGNMDSSSPLLTNVTFAGNSAGAAGGGMINSSSSPTLTHVTFISNTVSGTNYGGGGMYNDNSSPALTDVTFSGNTANNHGGGMYNDNSNPVLNSVTFSNNTAGSQGGGCYNFSSAPTLNRVIFQSNSATLGGGMSNESSNPRMTNAAFSGNSASSAGGGIYNTGSSPTLTNVSFSRNSASSAGGGMANVVASNPTIVNAILWGNGAQFDAEIHNNGSTPNVTYSIVMGGYAGAGNLNADPRFVDAVNGNLRLQADSPAIDAGNNAAVPGSVTTDLDGRPRIADGNDDGVETVDMGVYEVQIMRVFLPLVVRNR
ncbi:MAG: choice-of-anchor Q domain-containing protein [Anaerolineae bacterium]